MSLDADAFLALASAIKQADVDNCGADPANPILQARSFAIAAAISTFVKKASVVPTLLVAPTGGGPVTGTGTLE